MHFTPQQLAGAQRYGSKTRVGNWFEDLCLEEKEKVKNPLREKYDEKMRVCNQKVHGACAFVAIRMFEKKWQACQFLREEDGILRYGDQISLLHDNTGGMLSCDPYESAANDPTERATSVSRKTSPLMATARNTLVLLPVNNEDNSQKDGEVLRWGVPFQLACCPLLYEESDSISHESMTFCEKKRLLLASTIKTEHRMSPLSCEQIVYLTEKESSYDTHWLALMPAKSKNSGYDRFVNVGMPIPVGEQIVLQHCATQKLLASDMKYVISTDFGREYEVCANTMFGFGRVGTLRDEFDGSKTGNTNCRPEMEQNIWSFVIADSTDTDYSDDENNRGS